MEERLLDATSHHATTEHEVRNAGCLARTLGVDLDADDPSQPRIPQSVRHLHPPREMPFGGDPRSQLLTGHPTCPKVHLVRLVEELRGAVERGQADGCCLNDNVEMTDPFVNRPHTVSNQRTLRLSAIEVRPGTVLIRMAHGVEAT